MKAVAEFPSDTLSQKAILIYVQIRLFVNENVQKGYSTKSQLNSTLNRLMSSGKLKFLLCSWKKINFER